MSGAIPAPLEQLLLHAVRRVAESNVTGDDDNLAFGDAIHDDDGFQEIHADEDSHGDDHGDGHSEFVSQGQFRCRAISF